ncbi:hypothetical protein D3OALGA1CA_5800 [Olavius algarvensis associated proteobacterium Delta 3]|nr:hypothetical protein D3OALGA1CA_5800 [Olavius algarvensis associated proteobacterium Delta 3]
MKFQNLFHPAARRRIVSSCGYLVNSCGDPEGYCLNPVRGRLLTGHADMDDLKKTTAINIKNVCRQSNFQEL